MEIGNNKAISQSEDQGTTVHVRDAGGEPAFHEEKPVTITVAGTYSSRYRRAVESQRDRMMKQRRTTLSGEHLAKQQLELIASCIIAWDGFTSGGSPYALSKDNAVALLDSAPWIREQVEEAMSDHASFFPNPSTN